MGPLLLHGPNSSKRALVVTLEGTGQFLDALARRRSGEWLPGDYGCRWLRLSWLAWRLDRRWGAGVWPDQPRPAAVRTVGPDSTNFSHSLRPHGDRS